MENRLNKITLKKQIIKHNPTPIKVNKSDYSGLTSTDGQGFEMITEQKFIAIKNYNVKRI